MCKKKFSQLGEIPQVGTEQRRRVRICKHLLSAFGPKNEHRFNPIPILFSSTPSPHLADQFCHPSKSDHVYTHTHVSLPDLSILVCKVRTGRFSRDKQVGRVRTTLIDCVSVFIYSSFAEWLIEKWLLLSYQVAGEQDLLLLTHLSVIHRCTCFHICTFS